MEKEIPREKADKIYRIMTEIDMIAGGRVLDELPEEDMIMIKANMFDMLTIFGYSLAECIMRIMTAILKDRKEGR